MIGALIVDVAVETTRPRLEIVFSDLGLLGGAAGNRTRYRNRADLRCRRNLGTRNNAKQRERTCGDAKGVDGINMPQAYAACCWAAKSREMPQLRPRGIPN